MSDIDKLIDILRTAHEIKDGLGEEFTSQAQLEPGMRVFAVPDHAKDDPSQWENGIVKSLNEMMPDHVFVVYKCAGEWDNYQNYTGVNTHISKLRSGWTRRTR